MPKTRQQKKDLVTKLAEKLARASSVVFADYRGLTMAKLQELRKALREQEAEFSITKNNLLKLAIKDSSLITNYPSLFEGPTATLFAYGDQILPLKTMTKLIKDTKIGEIKLGLMDGEILDKYAIEKLASLPSKDELRAKIVGSLGAPLYGIVGVLQANLRNLVYALDGIRKQKGGDIQMSS
ncbi:50S ribosomal protein L10 [Candidatus Daviesbacteria bacterium]|nr:50S ribosomal protein L10 [Candidatus Daviesbacteria bacterium]